MTKRGLTMDLDRFFEREVKPALGCTETGAVAFAAAAAARYAGRPVEQAHIQLSPNMYKNGKNVGIPGTSGLRGNLMAAALGLVAGDPDKGLEGLAGAGRADIEKAQTLIREGRITEEVVYDVPEIYVEVELHDQKHRTTAVISERHDFLAEIRRDGVIIKHNKEAEPRSYHRRPDYVRDLLKQDMNSLWILSGSINRETERFLASGAEMNMAAARAGLERPRGLGIGYSLKQAAPKGDMLWEIKYTAAAAADFRMDGGGLPVMSSAGSGNHGLTAVLPPAVVAGNMRKSDKELAEALALSHLLTAYIKLHTGLLTPVCGCAVAAGMGATAAIVKLIGGNPGQAETAVASLMSSVLGMVCDGAKASCSMKVCAASGEAYVSAIVALAGHGVADDLGVIPKSLPKMAKIVETISKAGMSTMDATIIKIMQGW